MNLSLPKISLAILFFILASINVNASIKVGVATKDLTPPIGTPSAGYFEREGKGMVGIHDPLLATAIVIDNGDKIIALCSVDHMGFLYEMTQEVFNKVHNQVGLENCEIYIGSSHTHSGGGAYFEMPVVGELVAGPYDAQIKEFYIDSAVNAIIAAFQNLQSAKIGIGYGKTKGVISYNGVWPKETIPSSDIMLIKITKLDGSPIAVFFNTSLYPAVLDGNNMLFSSDLIGYARKHVASLIGSEVVPVFFNGSTGDIETNIPEASDLFESCNLIGKGLAQTIATIWNATDISDKLEIKTFRDRYLFESKPTLTGFQIPLENALTEINLIVLNQSHAFVTIPAEISCVYDPIVKNKGMELGFKHVSMANLINDAHGYIYTPQAWKLNPPESDFSFGGEMYGQLVEEKIFKLMQQASVR